MYDSDKPTEFDAMTKEQQEEIVSLIRLGMIAVDRFNTRHTSYGLKHYFEKYLERGYITNGQFKGAMLKAGFKAKDQEQQNWAFNISEKSPILRNRKGYYDVNEERKVLDQLIDCYFSQTLLENEEARISLKKAIDLHKEKHGLNISLWF